LPADASVFVTNERTSLNVTVLSPSALGVTPAKARSKVNAAAMMMAGPSLPRTVILSRSPDEKAVLVGVAVHVTAARVPTATSVSPSSELRTVERTAPALSVRSTLTCAPTLASPFDSLIQTVNVIGPEMVRGCRPFDSHVRAVPPAVRVTCTPAVGPRTVFVTPVVMPAPRAMLARRSSSAPGLRSDAVSVR